MPNQLISVANSVLRNYNTANAIPRLGGVSRGTSGLAGIRPSMAPSFGQKAGMLLGNIGSAIGSGLSAASGLLGGHIGLISTAADLIGGNIQAAKSQFDMEGFQDSLSDVMSDLSAAASNSNTTSDLISLAGNNPDFSDYIDSQHYEWDGNILHGIGALFGNAATERDKERARQLNEQAQTQFSNNLVNAGQRVSNIGYRQGMANFLNNAAMGGPLSTHGADFSDGLIRIDVGGTHEQNPYGGVPAGVDPQGIPNLVEEGETIWDDYVFSDRLKVPKSLVKKLGLGGSKKGITYADASKKIAENSGVELRPNDPISKRTEEAQLAELEVSQEEKRMKLEKNKLMKAISEMNPDELQGLFTAAQQSPVAMETQMPPQEVNEEPLSAEPVQGTGEYEPVGFACGGHKFLTGGQIAKIKEAFESGKLKYDAESDTYSGIVPGMGRRTYSTANLAKFGIKPAEAKPDSISTTTLLRTGQVKPQQEKPDSTIALARMSQAAEDARKAAQATQEASKQEESKQEESKNTYDFTDGLTGFRTVGNNGQRSYSAWNYGDSALNSAFKNWLNRGDYSDITSPGIYFADRAVSSAPQEQETPATKGTTGARKATTPATTPKLAAVAVDNTPLEFADSMPEVLASLAENDAATQKAVDEALETPVGITSQPDYKSLPTWMRYAPVVGGALSVLSDIFNPGDYSDYDRLISSSRRLSSPITIPVETIGDRIRRNPFDERLAVNQANQNFLASLRGTMDNAGGNRAYRQFANNLLAYNNQGALSEIARNAYLANRQDALQTADFNRATGIQNMNAINQRNLAQAQLNSQREQMGWNALAHATQMKDAAQRYDDQLASADFTGLMESLGNLGKENEQRNWLTSLGKEGILAYLMNNRGGIDFLPQATTTKCGGKMKTKKRRF